MGEHSETKGDRAFMCPVRCRHPVNVRDCYYQDKWVRILNIPSPIPHTCKVIHKRLSFPFPAARGLFLHGCSALRPPRAPGSALYYLASRLVWELPPRAPAPDSHKQPPESPSELRFKYKWSQSERKCLHTYNQKCPAQAKPCCFLKREPRALSHGVHPGPRVTLSQLYLDQTQESATPGALITCKKM